MFIYCFVKESVNKKKSDMSVTGVIYLRVDILIRRKGIKQN